MRVSRQELGQIGENLVANCLTDNGYKVIARNWRCPVGEIDIITRYGDELVFVEVRTRRGESYGTPEDSITAVKKAKLIELGETYVQEHCWDGPWRIDVAAVQFSKYGDLQRLTITEDAIEA